MKKSLFAIVYALCISNVNGMDSISEASQSTATAGRYTLSALRNTDDTFTVNFGDTQTTLFEKKVTISSLEVETSLSVGNGIEISKKENGDFILNLTKDFILPSGLERINMLFLGGYIEISGILHYDAHIAAYCKGLIIPSGIPKARSILCNPNPCVELLELISL